MVETETIVLITIIAIPLILYLILLLREKTREPYRKCICTSRNERVCQDGDLVQKLYEDNQLTEYSKLKGKGWNNPSDSPGGAEYPVSVGCPWS